MKTKTGTGQIQFEFLTLNKFGGRTLEQFETDNASFLADALSAVKAGVVAPIPNFPPYHVYLQRMGTEHFSFVTHKGEHDNPITHCVLSTSSDQKRSREIWTKLAAYYNSIEGFRNALGDQHERPPKTTCWLTTFTISPLIIECCDWLADFERSLAAALIFRRNQNRG